MDPAEFSSLNELLDRIATLGIATDYDRIGPKTDQGETFLPGQIFVFGGFVLRANSHGHLEQIDSYAPGH